MVSDGSLMVPDGSLMIPDGSLLVPDGSNMVPDGSIMVPDGTPIALSYRWFYSILPVPEYWNLTLHLMKT